jgi:Lipid A 3-O-deacylase (PagL)
LLSVKREPRIGVRALIQRAAVALIIGVGYLPRLGSAQSLCETCEVQIGIGETYHFWGTTGGVVLPVTLSWTEGRYELGLFRISTRQILYDAHYRYGRVMADPYWGISMSRRWRLFDRGPIRGFFGFGVAAKNESDQLSITRLDFASQLGLRFPMPGNRAVGELTFRHWSNGGIRLPNHGQDFVTLTFRLNSGLVGVDKTEEIRVAELGNYKGALNPNAAAAANLP